MDRLIPTVARELLGGHAAPFVEVFRHGSLNVEYYAPRSVDLQKPHPRDEIYVVISGTGIFRKGEHEQPFEPGEVLFVPAQVEHSFIDFSEDFSTWVFFYGPEGGEAD